MTQLTIRRLGHRGDGIADGPIFVPRALPGEVVEGDITGDRMDAPRILEPSPDRVAAPCRHYRGCGGCALQHVRDPVVAAWKQEVVRTALAAHGLETAFRAPRTSPPHSRRRAAFSARRTKKGAIVGFHGRGSQDLVAVPECHVIRPALADALPLLERWTTAGASRKAEITFAVTETDTGLDVAATGGKPLDAQLRQELASIGAEWPVARLIWEDEPVFQETPPRLQIGEISVSPPPGAFLQATKAGEAALRDAVDEALGPASRIIDLFAGCGTFALPISRRAVVHAVEGDAALTAALDEGWRGATGLQAVTVETRDLMRRPVLPEELVRFDAAVIDPPRAGAEAQIAQLALSGVPIIAAVSCNPVTFARDAAHLVSSGFTLEWVQVVDQFRWSPHVELAACFRRT